MSEFKWSETKCTEMFSTSFILAIWAFSLFSCVIGTLQDTDYMMEDSTPQVYRSKYDPKNCGDGITDPGEECDCGQYMDCLVDPCCQPTCQFKLDSQCSNHEPCCDNCKLMRRSTVCRNVSHECDIPEYCTGERSDCPANTHKRNGAICSNGGSSRGVCIGGVCKSFYQPCSEGWAMTDSGPIPDMVKCTAETVCINQTCVKLSHFRDTHSCPLNSQGLECSGNGDCSNVNVCHCHPGWEGSDCSTKDNKPVISNHGRKKTIKGPRQDDSTSDTIALAGGLVAFVLTVSILFVAMACRFLPTRTPKDDSSIFPPAHVETIDPDPDGPTHA